MADAESLSTNPFTLLFLSLPVVALGLKLSEGDDARRVLLTGAEFGGDWTRNAPVPAVCSKRITDHIATADCQRWLLHCLADGANERQDGRMADAESLSTNRYVIVFSGRVIVAWQMQNRSTRAQKGMPLHSCC